MSKFIELFSVVGYRMDMSVGNPPNAHQGYQLFYNLKGKAVYVLSGKKYVLDEGNSIIVPPFVGHSVLSTLGTELVTIDIQFIVREQSFDKQVRKIASMVHDQTAYADLLFEMISSTAKTRRGNFYYIVRDLLEALLLIWLDEKEECRQAVVPSVENYDEFSVCTKRAINYLDGMVTGNHRFDLDYIAKILGHNKQYLCKTFIDETGMTIKQYLMMLRIEKAKELLEYTDFSIRDISEMLNFGNYTYFGRMFKVYAGMTPHDYRKKANIDTTHLSYSFRDKSSFGENHKNKYN